MQKLLAIACILALTRTGVSDAPRLSCDSQLRIVLPRLFAHCSCSYSDWSAWKAAPRSVARVPLSQCGSGEAYNETRTQSVIGQGCQSRTERRTVCKFTDVMCTEVFDEVYIYYSTILKRIPYIYRGNGFSHVTGHYGGVEGVFDCMPVSMPVTTFVSCTVTVSKDGKISEHAFLHSETFSYPPSRSQ